MNVPQGSATSLQLSLDVSPEPLRVGQPVRWTVTVMNPSDHRIVIPTGGPRVGVRLLRDDEVRYEWSVGRESILRLGYVFFDPRSERRYDLDEESLDVEPGTYEAEADLLVVNAPAPRPIRRVVLVE